MTQREILFDSINEYMTALKEAGIDKVALAVVNEKRSIQKDHERVAVEHIYSADALAYKSSAIYRFRAEGGKIDEAELTLAGAGFHVTRRNRNIT